MAAIADASDERLRQVSFTAVRVSSCMQFARVYWLPLAVEAPDERERKRTQRALVRAAGFFRGRLADEMHVRQVPELRFVYDESVETGRRIEEVLADLEIPAADDGKE